MKKLAPIILALFLLAPITLAENAEVKEARSATVEHNKEIETAKERLESLIIRAEQDYARQAIRSKMAYNKELQKAKRTALQNDNTDNATAIIKQIERVNKQIDHLKNVLAGRTRLDPADNNKTDAKEDTRDEREIDPRYVGIWKIQFPSSHRRSLAINDKGLCRVLSDSDNRGENVGVGNLYKGEIVDGCYVVRFTDWTIKDAPFGRILFIKLNGDDSVSLALSQGDIRKIKTFDEAKGEVFLRKYSDLHTPLDGDNKDDRTPDNDEKTKDDAGNDDDTSDDDGEGFFGIPLE
jgi:hypothetical protein